MKRLRATLVTLFALLASSGAHAQTPSVYCPQSTFGTWNVTPTPGQWWLCLSSLQPQISLLSNSIYGTLGLAGTPQGLPMPVTGTGQALGWTAGVGFGTVAAIGTATALAGGIANDIPYQTASGVTAFVAPANSAVMVYGPTGIPAASSNLPTIAVGTPLTVATALNQASGGSTLLPFASTSGIATGNVVSGTNITAGTTVSSIVSTAAVTQNANGSFSTGQKVIPMAVTTGYSVGQQCTDNTLSSVVPAGNVIGSIQAATSITMTSNLTHASSGTTDSITCDPVVTLSAASTGTIAAAAAINFYPNATAATAAGSGTQLVNGGEAVLGNFWLAGNLNGGTPLYLGGALGTPSSGSLINTTGLPLSTGITGFGTGVATALSNTTNASGGVTTFGTDLPLAGGTLTGELITKASGTGAAGFNLPPGTAPSSPANGDCWTTTLGLYCQINGSTAGPFASGGNTGSTLISTQTAATATFTASQATTVLTVTAVSSGTITVGQQILGTGVLPYEYIASNGTGSGGTGTYNVSLSATVSSEAMTSLGSSSFIFFPLPTTYNTIKFQCSGVYPTNSTSGQTLAIIVGEGGTPTYETASYYWTYNDSTGTYGSSHGANASSLLVGPGSNGIGGTSMSITGYLSNPASTIVQKPIYGDFIIPNVGGSLNSTGTFGGDYYNDENPITAVKITFPSYLIGGSCSEYGMNN